MKKTLTLLLITAIPHTDFTHTPQNGPLTLGDQPQINQLTLALSGKRGIIMEAIMTYPDFREDLTKFCHFFNIATPQALPAYQDIVETLKTSSNSDGAIEIIEAFEKAIMKKLHHPHYIFCTEGKVQNIFFTGLKWNWFYPSEWVNPESWLSSVNSDDRRQLIDELEQLSDIAAIHSVITSKRLKLKIAMYRSHTLLLMGIISAIGTGVGSGIYLKNKLFNE